MSDTQHTGKQLGSGGGTRSMAEWTTLVVSVLLVGSLLATVSWLELQGNGDPPQIVVEPGMAGIWQADDLFYLPVTIRNSGDATAEDATIQAELVDAQGQTETSDITVAFLAAGEHVEAVLVFSSDPGTGRLTLRPTGFLEP